MKRYFYINKPISATDIFNGRLLKYNMHEEVTEITSKQCRYLVDQEQNKLTVVCNEQNCATCLIVENENTQPAWLILSAIATEFHCDLEEETSMLHH